MNRHLHISTQLDQPALLKDMIEKLAYRRYDIGYGQEIVPGDQQALETSSTETYLSGTVAIEDGDETIQMPFITCFLFTCIKDKDRPYELAWSASLS